MAHFCRIALCVALLGLVWLRGAAAQQQANGGAKAPAANSEEPEAKEMPVVEVKNPAVEAILETKPSTPSERVRAAKILSELDRPDLAKQFLQQVLDAKLNSEQLAALGSEFGAGVFVRLSARADLAPEAGQLADAVLEAVNQQLQAPKRIAGLIQQLSSPSADARYAAMASLREAREAAVGPLVAVLADPARAAEHANVRAALLRLGADAVPPLLGILYSPDTRWKVAAIGVLAELGVRESVYELVAALASPESDLAVRAAAKDAVEMLTGRVPTQAEAVELLVRQARRYFDGTELLPEKVPGKVELWTWDNKSKQPVAEQLSAEDASLTLAARLAADAYAIAPDEEPVKLLHLATLLERAKYAGGLGKPLDEAAGKPAGVVAAFGPKVVEKLLAYVLEANHAPAAAAAARILGNIGTGGDVLGASGEPSPLVRALRSSDRRVRLAAAAAILRLAPDRPFPGSSYVPEVLTFLASTSGARRALVASPTSVQALKIGGFLESLGYQTDIAMTGDQLLRQALASPDYELVFVDSTLDGPPVQLLLQQLRHDCRTADLPVGVFARAGDEARAEHLVRHDPLAMALPRVHELESARWQVQHLMALTGRGNVGQTERLEEAGEALELLTSIASGPDQEVYRLKGAEQAALTALYVPGLTARAIALLGALGTAESQTALVDLASRNRLPLESRKAAALAFGRAVERRGILLTTQQILHQYDRYNQSESADVPTQKVLGMILDCIEAPTRSTRPAEGAATAPAATQGKDG